MPGPAGLNLRPVPCRVVVDFVLSILCTRVFQYYRGSIVSLPSVHRHKFYSLPATMVVALVADGYFVLGAWVGGASIVFIYEYFYI